MRERPGKEFVAKLLLMKDAGLPFALGDILNDDEDAANDAAQDQWGDARGLLHELKIDAVRHRAHGDEMAMQRRGEHADLSLEGPLELAGAPASGQFGVELVELLSDG